MRTPRIFIAYAPRAGLRCAVAYLDGQGDAYGWFIGQADGGSESAYFVLEDFYTPRETRYVAVPERELHSKWTRDEAMCHELARLQEAFSREWLCYRGDPDCDGDFEQYDRAELAEGDVIVRFERLARFSKAQPTWTHYSPDCEHTVLRGLSKRWPLDYRTAET